MYLVSALAGISLLGVFLVPWLLALHLEEIDYNHLFSLDGITALCSGISSGTLATLFGLVAAAALLLPEKLKLLYRTL